MKSLKDMSIKERNEYGALLGDVTKSVITPDAKYVLIVYDIEGNGFVVSEIENQKLPNVLRSLANSIENQQSFRVN